MSQAAKNDSLTFKTANEAFDHACKEHNCIIVPEQPLLAIVLDAKAEFGDDQPITFEGDGCARLTLKVASEDGGYVVLSRTTKPPKQPLNVGDLVCWVPIKHDAPLSHQANDERFGWIGLVFATLEPVWEDDEWVLREFYE